MIKYITASAPLEAGSSIYPMPLVAFRNAKKLPSKENGHHRVCSHKLGSVLALDAKSSLPGQACVD